MRAGGMLGPFFRRKKGPTPPAPAEGSTSGGAGRDPAGGPGRSGRCGVAMTQTALKTFQEQIMRHTQAGTPQPYVPYYLDVPCY